MSRMRFLVFVGLCFICVSGVPFSGKALFCRDPDSGKLHDVNSTWPSSSFCGNYTCKLRRRNVTETEYTPIRELNITVQDHPADKNKSITIERKKEPEIVPILHKNLKSDTKNMINSNLNNLQLKNADEKKEEREKNDIKNSDIVKAIIMSNQPQDNGDRYLTEQEINSISSVLHTVKKGDLDAIVEIYNLAQDIYKEMDKVTDEELVQEALNLIEEDEKHKKSMSKPSSYWYHPFGNKGKMADRYDMDNHGSNQVYSTVKPKSIKPTYFLGPLTKNDFGKLPYYYPISDFQRMSSYTHQPSQFQKDNINSITHNAITTKPCKNKSNQITNREPESQKLIQPSPLLPYPFATIHNYNSSEYPGNVYYKVNPWKINYYNKYKYYQPYYNAYIDPIPKAILINPHLSNEVQDEEQKPVHDINEKKSSNVIEKRDGMPDWKTAPISEEVLKDIRANIDTSKLIKAFPLRRKVNIDRVGKLIRIDDLNISRERLKRSCKREINTENEKSTEDSDEYEAYLEKITCHTTTDPGFFRIGNLTHPYPDCCPQKIESS